MSKEYTYDIEKYTIGVDENCEDGIGLTVAMVENNEIKFLGNCYGDNARCIDLLIRENQEYKEQNENLKYTIEKYYDVIRRNGIKLDFCDRTCKYCGSYNGDGVEDTNYFDYYSCELLNEMDRDKYDCYDSVENKVFLDNCKYFMCDTCKYKEKISKEVE